MKTTTAMRIVRRAAREPMMTPIMSILAAVSSGFSEGSLSPLSAKSERLDNYFLLVFVTIYSKVP